MRLLIVFFALACIIFPAVSAGARWAVLVATTKSMLYYRHQSTVMHAYETLLANGFKKDHIITMTYDDIANNPKNLEKGVVRNHPYGPNLYPGFKKDYTGDKVNAENFVAVLTGDAIKAKGPVIKSGPRDTIFIYIIGYGASQYLTFPTGPGLSAQKFVDVMKKIRSEKKAKKILVKLEVSYAASIVAGIIPRNDNIFVITATHFEEIPAAVYCSREKKLCYGSLFGCAWTQRSDRLRQLKFGRKESLFEHMNTIRTLTVYTHVNMYGHLEIGRGKLREFLAYKLVRKPNVGLDSVQIDSGIISQLGRAALEDLENKLDEDPDNEEYIDEYDALNEYLFEDTAQNGSVSILDQPNDKQESGSQDMGSILDGLDVPAFMNDGNNVEQNKKTIAKNRAFVTNTMKHIFKSLKSYGYDVNYENMGIASPLTNEQADIYHNAIQAFSTECIDVNENTYTHIEVSKLANLAEMGVKLEDQIKAMKNVCTNEHREAKSIH